MPRSRPGRRLAASLCAMALVAASGCSDASGTGSGTDGPLAESTHSPSPDAASLRGDLEVLASSDLRPALTAIGRVFEESYPGVQVRFTFLDNRQLLARIEKGGRGDVVASLGAATMTALGEAGAIGTLPVTFATSTLVIAVPPGNPGHVDELRDFADPNRAVGLCSPKVQCGSAADLVLEVAQVIAAPRSRERDANATLALVAAGKAEAVLAYRYDVAAAGPTVEGIEFPESEPATVELLAATLSTTRQSVLAITWIKFLLSQPSAAQFRVAGFDSSIG